MNEEQRGGRLKLLLPWGHCLLPLGMHFNLNSLLILGEWRGKWVIITKVDFTHLITRPTALT
jgi:hypothetical protein